MKTTVHLTLLATLIFSLTGCSLINKRNDPTRVGPFVGIANVYQPAGLPPNLQRVAILPLVPGRANRDAERGVPLVRQTFAEEFSRARIFDTVLVSPYHLEQLTGARALYADSELPVDFTQNLTKGTACQAVLFAELTTYRAYPPIAIGWKLHLFDLQTEQLLWATDEVFDTGQAPVANALRRHMRENLSPNNVAPTEIIVLDSPRELARFTLSALISTFIQNNPKVTLNSAEATTGLSQSGAPGPGNTNPDPAEAERPETPQNPAPPAPNTDTL